MPSAWVRRFFQVAAVYDLALGLAFLVAFKPIYRWCGIELPNHDAYVQFAAATVAIFGLGFWYVSTAPRRNRDIIRLGILFKLAFAVTALAYVFAEPVSPLWIAFAAADLVFAVLFVWALRTVLQEQSDDGQPAQVPAGPAA